MTSPSASFTEQISNGSSNPFKLQKTSADARHRPIGGWVISTIAGWFVVTADRIAGLATKLFRFRSGLGRFRVGRTPKRKPRFQRGFPYSSPRQCLLP
jgi:hypothetical protein